MAHHRVAVLAGDGVGPEVISEAVAVLHTVGACGGPSFAFQSLPWGTSYLLEHGRMMPEDALATLDRFDAILLGAVGDPRVPDHETLWGMLLPIRQSFDLFVNKRPIRLLRGIPSALSSVSPPDIDIMVFRENTEGEYAGKGDLLFPGDADRETALQLSVFSRRGTERIIRHAFSYAKDRGLRVTSVSKGNALNYTGVFWDRVFKDVGTAFPTVEKDQVLVDAAAMFLVRNPRRFEVIVTSNLFGDILTDLGAAISGGMGVAASANLDPTRRHPSLFEPVHGSAPDIAGQGRANPFAAIWSAGLMLEHFGYPTFLDVVLSAIQETALSGLVTPDIGGTASTQQVGRAVRASVQRQLKSK